MNRVRVWVAAALAVCSGCLDAPPSSTGPGVLCSWAARHLDPCSLPAPEAIELGPGSWLYDTSTGELRGPDDSISQPPSELVEQGGGPILRALSATTFAIAADGELRVIGEHPLLIASALSIDIDGTMDLSSARNAGNPPGAGANSNVCNPALPGSGTQDSGGGGGGGFGGRGGDGGQGGTGAPGTGSGPIVSPPTMVMGGCSGAQGGGGTGRGGSGGGGLQLTAGEAISVAGHIHVGGAGGLGGKGDNGGGGGGSGGYIGLDAPSMALEPGAVLAANGGGGGTGCESGTGDPGVNGQPSASRSAGGSSGCETPAPSGDGGALGDSDGDNGQPSSQSGGGGGGAAGYVIAFGDGLLDQAEVVSPAVVTVP